MKLTILEVGEVPEPIRPEFGSYPEMFVRMLDAAGADFDYETIRVVAGVPLPDIDAVEAVLIPGSVYGVYDKLEWMDPLRAFVRAAYAAKIPMIGVCFGHQIIADALGGDVRKSDKGWGLGRVVYDFVQTPGFATGLGPHLAIAASHQDQVITPPKEAEVFLATDFTPNAGLIYNNGVTMSVQPHPEFEKPYAVALAELRRNTVWTDAEVDGVNKSLEQPLDSPQFAKAMVRFFNEKS